MTTNIESGSAVAYSYANPRKQAVRTAFGYTNLYDLCGNMIVRHGGLTNSQAMVYDAENRLKIFSQAGKVVVEYGYAADGARLWKRTDQSPTNVQVWIGNIYEEKGGKVLFHVFTDGQQVCSFETNSALSGGSDTNRVAYYYHEDNLNSSSALSDSSHNQIEVDSYYPFGRALTANPQASFQVSRRFTGQVFDNETGLYYYNARYFDPELGRFIQADPKIPDLANPQSYNRYSYCLNNPLRYTDPTGHDPAYSMMFAGLSARETVDAARIAAPITIGASVAVLTGGAATPLLVSAGASTTFAAIGSGMIAGAAGDLASQGTQIGLGQRKSISGQEVAVSSLAGGALNGAASKIASLKATPAATEAQTPTVTRYMSQAEADLAGSSGEIPNVNQQGIPRPTHVTTDSPLNSASKAQKVYELPVQPTHRATVPAQQAGPLGPAPSGPKTSGGGSQNATSQPIPVKPEQIHKLGD
jgi:RHS repeat-associated protein